MNKFSPTVEDKRKSKYTDTHMYLHMGTKNIAIREDVYKKLSAIKQDDESFSEIIDRLLEKKTSLSSFAGIFKADDKELEIVEEEARKIRKSASLRVHSP